MTNFSIGSPEEIRAIMIKGFQERVPFALNSYLAKTTKLLAPNISFEKQVSLICYIQSLIIPVFQDSDLQKEMDFDEKDDNELAKILDPYINQFLPYGPKFLRVFICYEALSRFSYWANVLRYISYIGARIAYYHATDSYAVIEGLLLKVDSFQLETIKMMGGFHPQDGQDVLRRQQFDVTGILYYLAMPVYPGWPGSKDVTVCNWAKERLEKLYRQTNNADVIAEIKSILEKLDRKSF